MGKKMALTANINLSVGTITIEDSPAETVQKYLGSRGYAEKILYDNVGPEVEPLSPENFLIFSTGPFTGTPWSTSARFTVTAKSPLTGAYGYANSSGFFGPELRKAGFDALVFEGKSKSPVILVIDDNKLSLVDGSDLWGKDTEETEDILSKRYNGSKVASIGPGGENLVKISSVINDYERAATRTGVGAVMGSKNLKAVVVHASSDIEYPDSFKKICLEMMKQIGKHPEAKFLRKWGTAALIDPKNVSSDLPAKNHQEVQVSYWKDVNAEKVDQFLERNDGCYNCPIRCSRFTKVKDGPYKCSTEGPEYETINSFGPMVGNNSMELINYSNLLCNKYGLDTISTGVSIAFAMEYHQRGLLNDEKLSLEWGDEKSITGLIEAIASRKEGIGDLLADGVKRAAEKIGQGADHYAMYVKGMEIPRQEPRTTKGMALGHSTSNRGADHLYALPTIDLTGNVEVATKFFPECMPEILERTSEKYKPEMNILSEAYCAISDDPGVCKFTTTEPTTLIDMETKEIISDGMLVDLDYMLDRYYRLRNWTKDGIPSEDKLIELELEDTVRDL
jgi:aldehyde:ferredoxin oxidoreductase